MRSVLAKVYFYKNVSDQTKVVLFSLLNGKIKK